MLINLYNWVVPLFSMMGSMVSNSRETQTSLPIVKVHLVSNQVNTSIENNMIEREISALSPIAESRVSDLEIFSIPNLANRTEEVQERSLLGKIVGFTVFSALAITGISGNGLVIFAVFTDPAVQAQNQISNLAILSLAYSDMMTSSVLCIPAALCMWFDEYPLGMVWCRIWAVINLTGICVTMNLLGVVSVDRFVAIKWSLHYPQYVTFERLQGVCRFVWVYSLLVSIGWGLFPVEYDFNTGLCDMTWQEFGPEVPEAFYYGIFGATIVAGIPSSLIVLCNIAIIQMSKAKGASAKVQDSSGGEAGKDKKQESKVNARILKAMLIVIISYAILTVPVAVIRVVKILSGPSGAAKHIPSWVTLIITFCQLSASIVNPLIYGLLRKDFQEAFRRIWKRMIGR